MKTHTYINNLYKLVIALLLTTVFNACVDDDWGNTCPGTATGDIKITLTLQVPGVLPSNQVTTRAMPADETNINQIQVLLFKPEEGDLVGSYPGTNITTPSGEPGKRSFTVEVIEGTFDIMVLANSTDIITSANLAKDMSRREVSSRLHFRQIAKIAHDANTLIPFWGELKAATIREGGELDNIPLLRALVKIDFLLDEAVKDEFTLQTITLYHWQNEMALLPDAANYNSTDAKVTAATNTGTGLIAVDTKATYTAEAGEIEDDEKIEAKIYLNETPHPGPDDFPEMPCLVVGGEYKGETRYYRVDFFRTDEGDPRTYHDLLRNHWYELKVEKILSPGSPTEEEAYQSNNINLEVTVSERDEGDIDVPIDGQYQLKVNKASFYFDREARDQDSFNNDLEIFTNHEDGWEITSVTDPEDDDAEIDMDNGWLRILPEHRKGDQGDTTIKLLLDKNEGTDPRKAEIRLQVGRLLDFIVKVTQGTDTQLELSVEDLNGNPVGELFFYEYYGWDDTHIPQDIRVRWSPKGGNYHCKVEIGLYGDRAFVFDDQSSVITPGNLNDTEGFREYTISPKAFTEEEVSEKTGNPFLHRGMRVTFTVTDEQSPDISISKTLYLRHQHFAIIARGLDRDARLGRNYDFDILSNTSWEFVNVEDEGILGPITPLQTKGGNDILNGDPFHFDLRDLVPGSKMPAEGVAGRKATFYFQDLQGYIPGLIPVTITATYNDPNSYILNPAGTEAERTVDIPIRKLFWVWDLYAGQPLENITATNLQGGVVWDEVYLNSDLNGIKQPYGITAVFEPDASNLLESVLHVTIPSSTTLSGNAVVGIHRNNEWLYSWHIWITGYNPDSGLPDDEFRIAGDEVIMKRNLGALEYDGNVVGQSVNGLFYQMGRKDPMHPSFVSGQSPEVNAINNLGNALNHPDLFYRAPGGLRDWFTNQPNPGYQNRYLWNTMSNQKGVFDPCPQGWRLTGADPDKSIHEWSNVGRYSNNRIDDGNQRPISIELRDGTFTGSIYSKFWFSGKITPQGNWEEHTNDTGQDAKIYVGLRAPTPDNPTQGRVFYRSPYAYQENGNVERASAVPIRCVKEK
ncbi:MAG: hypothetical protein LUG98_09400 [Tannerellaceae bacterium]|nr:hypothetical protein [Tannerellaceae bacterium]